MKYQLIKDLTIKTGAGEMLLKEGQVISLSDDKARGLINTGHAQAFCFFLDKPVNDCVYPCTVSKKGLRGTESECQHFRAYWKQRAGKLPTPDLRPEQDEFSRLYKMHMERLSQADLLADEIPPARLKLIHDSIDEMDKAFLRGDLEDFKNAMNETERLYFKAEEIHKKEG